MNTRIAAISAAFVLTSIVHLVPGHAQEPPPTDESLTVYLSHVDDGGCSDAAVVAEAEYSRTGGPLEATASVRTAPSGGDCRRDATAYRFDVERAFALGGSGWDAIAKFVAAEHAVAAPYGLVDEAGALIARADGGPLFATLLPAGTAQTVIAAIGVSRSTPIGEIDFALNLVPVDWAVHEDGRTLHLGWTQRAGAFAFGLGVDVGEETFGDFRVTWSRGNAQCKFEHAWGLGTIDAGVPAVQTVAGAPFALQGDPRDWRRSIGCGLSFAL